jgi:hypothetical protein
VSEATEGEEQTSEISKSSQAKESPVRREGHDISVERTKLIGCLTERIKQSDMARHLASCHDEARAVRRPLHTVDSSVFGLRDRARDRAIKVDDEETSVAVVGVARGVHITMGG